MLLKSLKSVLIPERVNSSRLTLMALRGVFLAFLARIAMGVSPLAWVDDSVINNDIRNCDLGKHSRKFEDVFLLCCHCGTRM